MLIDTNFYSALDKGDKQAIELIKAFNAMYIPIIVIGELYYGFYRGSQFEENTNKLDKFLSLDKTEILHISRRTVEHYGDLAAFCREKGRVLANNDIWIAALALEHDLPLATFDRDFTVFKEYLGDKLIILG